jgi:gamma-aminobutyric acid type B receptor
MIDQQQQQQQQLQQRRVSVGASMKSNFVVSQSDLWDTQTLSHAKQHSRHSPRNQQARCPDHTYVNAPLQQSQSNPQQSTPSSLVTTPQHETSYENGSPGNVSIGSGGSQVMHRSVSEKNRKHRHKQKAPVCQSETDSEREQRIDSQLCSQNRKLAKSHHSHHQSTPNVGNDGTPSTVAIRQHKHRSKSRDHHHHHRSSSNIHACSESELIDSDTAILPIFRKLLTEKDSRYRVARNAIGASCPNISIKCDIVEYL